MESLIIYSIIFFIILISLMILYISLNPLELKDKNIEKFYAANDDELPPIVPKVLQGLSPDTYIENNVEGSSNEKYIIIKKNTTIEFPKDFPNCQLFMIGGGGGAGYNHGGGGGAGAYYLTNNITFNKGQYNIIIGTGGIGGSVSTSPINGSDTYIIYNGNDVIVNNLKLRCKGGGACNMYNKNPLKGNDGGCGGGADGWSGDVNTNSVISGGNSDNSGTVGIGYRGGSARQYYNNRHLGGGGGGGIGGPGRDVVNGEGAEGGNGLVINITGTEKVYGGGGGGGEWPAYSTSPAGLGGGATLSNGIFIRVGGNAVGLPEGSSGDNGVINTGSGGGGGKGGNGGKGGSGVVIIRYKPIKQELPLVTARNPADINLSLNTELNNILTARKPFTLFSKINKDINLEIDYYVQEALIQDAIGVEKYIVAYSSYINELTSPLRLFSYDNTITNNTGAQFGINRYDKTTGIFINSISKPMPIKYIINVNNKDNIIDNQINGDWVFIKFPTSFILVQYGFVANIAFENKAPGDWILFGRDSTASSDNKAYHIIDRAIVNSGSSCPDMSCADGRKSWKDYANKESLLNVNLLDNKKKCNEYIFIFTRLAYSDLRNNIKEGHQLHFKEIRMRSRE